MKNFATKDDLKNLATKDDIVRLERRIDCLENRIDKLEERMDKLEERMDRLEERMDKLEGYVREKFLLIENVMMPKIDAMYEALTTRVSHGECDERMGQIEDKADAITPLLIAVRKNTEKLSEHEERLKKLESPA